VLGLPELDPEEGAGVTTGYEVQMYNDIRQIAQNTNRIANCLEAQEMRAREKPKVDPKDLGAYALWKAEVSFDRTRVGFSEWQAWHESDRADMEEQVKGDG
jgi:hypothetical protein